MTYATYLDKALEMPDQERAAWLASLYQDDPTLAGRLETLLNEHRALAEERFLERRPAPVFREPAGSGSKVGAYTLIALLGQGGTGTVWLAERSDGRFERRAAVKFLHIGAFQPQRRGAVQT
jgi:hypothetical protein